MTTRQVGNYTIDSVIGDGSFGTVYLGHHSILGRETALKILKIKNKEEAQRRLDLFIREARILAKIDDPRIIKIYDVFLSEEGPCIAMELINGEDLYTYYQVFERSYSEVAMLFGQAIQGLYTLHNNNIIHRDLKPENLLVNFNPIELKITDFGLAFATDDVALQTIHGNFAGTMLYMSPEQLDCKEIDHRSDIWSMGVILYQLITGELPFKPVPYVQFRNQVHSGQYPKVIAEDCPKWATNLIEGMLQVNPEDRFKSCREILKRLPINTEIDTETMLKTVVRMLPDKEIPIDREELIRIAARDLGIQRVGKRIRHQFLNAISRGVNRGLITRIDTETICRR